MKQILAMILALTLVFGCIPTPVLAEETTIQTQASVISIAMDALPVKTEYQIGDALDITGGSLSVSYSDGTMQTIELSADMVSGFNSTVACVQTLTVTYDGLTANFDIEVKDIPIQNDGSDILTVSEDAEITGIRILSTPTKKYYICNQDEFDATGGLLEIQYSDGSSNTVTMTNDMISGFDNTTVGGIVLTVHYENWTTYFTTAIIEKHYPTNYQITSSYPKTKYFLYEELDLQNTVVTLWYTDGTSREVTLTNDMVTGFDSTITGQRQISVNADGFTIGFNITVIDNASGMCGPDTRWELAPPGVLTIFGTGEATGEIEENVYGCPWEGYQGYIKTVVIQEGIDSIGQGLFGGHNNLETVQLPNSLNTIESAAFSHCKNLRTINLPEGITRIEQHTFNDCAALSLIELPESLEEICYQAFYGCTSLTKIVFHKKITSLATESFANCTNLKEITFEGKESPSVWDAFVGVTAKGYYPGTTYWSTSFFNNCGGDIDWISNGTVAENIKFDRDYMECYVSGESSGWTLSVVGIPTYVGIDCEFSVDSDVIKLGETSGTFCTFSTLKAGTATITATDIRSGCTATATIVVSEPKEIFNGYEEVIQRDTYYVTQEYSFTPSEAGEYIFHGTSNNIYDKCSFYVSVKYMQDGEWKFVDSSAVNVGDSSRFSYNLEADRTYRVIMDTYSSIGDMEGKVDVTFSLNKVSEITGIEILGGNRVVYGVVGETFWHYGLNAKLLPENAVGEIVWESSNPELISVYADAYSYGIRVQGEGSAILTAKCGEYSDSITVTTKKPQQVFLNAPVQENIQVGESYLYAFTPDETGRYVFELETALKSGYLENWLDGKYMPEDIVYTNTDSTRTIHGTFTAGITYYLYISGYGIRGENAISIVTVKKEELKPVAMEVFCSNSYDSNMYFSVNFIPSNSYDRITSWESSNTDILDIRSSSSGNSKNFYIYGSGEVTITAVSESGLRASCTVTVGQCYNGHTYGAWRQTKAKTCTIDGQETATCICGLRKYQPIPATGHNYDDNCDTACNDCGATRTVEHDFSGNWLYSETAHWHNCTICGEQSDIRNHIPGAAATQETPQTCTECGYVIKGVLGHSHSYGTELTVDEAGHWYACSGCSARKNYNAHSYTSVCDADCNDCGFTRKNIHVSGGTWVSDKAGHWQSCTKCNTKLNYATHVPGAAATANTAQICSICRYEIQKAIGNTTTNTVTNTIYQTVTQTTNHSHKYSDMFTLDEIGHWYACSGCTSKKEYAKHKFVNDCDADCDTCGYTRNVSHATDAKWSADGTGHWYACKNCGEKTSFAYHQQENGTCLICKQSMVDAQIPALGDTTETPPVVPNSNTTSAPSVPESGGPTINTTETVFSQEESAGLPWVALVITSVVSSIATLSVVVILVWLNRKKLIMLLVNN